jgi:hypothetical protein
MLRCEECGEATSEEAVLRWCAYLTVVEEGEAPEVVVTVRAVPSGSSRTTTTETAVDRAGPVFEPYDEPKLGARWLSPASAAYCF